MESIEQLRKNVRIAKNNLIKESRVLLHQLEQLQEQDEAVINERARLSVRISYLEEEIMEDISRIAPAEASRSRLKLALEDLKRQLQQELIRFHSHGDNADKVLDINFRIREIEEVLTQDTPR